MRGNYDLAVLGFRQYLESFPDTELADNASYWIGESYYSQGKYQQAIREFDGILRRYPRSDKLASGLLKKGYAYLGARPAGAGRSPAAACNSGVSQHRRGESRPTETSRTGY